MWDTVGGHWIEGETHEQTLIRELGEELGVLPLKYHLLAVVADPRPDLNGEGYYYVYLVTKWNGKPRNLRKDEHSKLAWVRLDEVEKLDLVSPDLVTLFRSIRKSAKGD